MSLRCKEWFGVHEVDGDGGREAIDGVRGFTIAFTIGLLGPVADGGEKYGEGEGGFERMVVVEGE
jgi:hypothetical protein